MEIVVQPGHLQALASKQTDASAEAESASKKGSGFTDAVWMSHGMLSEPSNSAFSRAEDARQDACEAIQKAIDELATKLCAAADIYQGVDQDAGDIISGDGIDQ